jgi:hypothetical protein
VFLNNEIQKQLQTLAYYKEKRITLMNEAHKINQRLNRVQVRFNSNFNNKFFLMCVKNETNQPHLFCEEDRLEYEKDMQKLQFLMNIGSIEITNPLKAEETRSLIEKEMEMFNKQNTQSLYFNSSEHFLLNVNKISSRVTLLMNEYNESQTVLKKLRNELEQTKLEIRNDEKNNLFWELEIDDKEREGLSEEKVEQLMQRIYNGEENDNNNENNSLIELNDSQELSNEIENENILFGEEDYESENNEINYGNKLSTMTKEGSVWRLSCGFKNKIIIEELDLSKTATKDGQTCFYKELDSNLENEKVRFEAIKLTKLIPGQRG